MSEEEQEKLYDLLFKDTKNKLEKKIEKQQEEIEKYKYLYFKFRERVNYLENKYLKLKICKENEDYISKDKIRAKIKVYQNKLFQDIEENKVVEYENIIQVLEELLEEE